MLSPSPIDLALARVRGALEWRFWKAWAASAAFGRLLRLRSVLRAVERGKAAQGLAIAVADDFVDHVRAAGAPRTMVMRQRRGRP